jgi:hypothetical protein
MIFCHILPLLAELKHASISALVRGTETGTTEMLVLDTQTVAESVSDAEIDFAIELRKSGAKLRVGRSDARNTVATPHFYWPKIDFHSDRNGCVSTTLSFFIVGAFSPVSDFTLSVHAVEKEVSISDLGNFHLAEPLVGIMKHSDTISNEGFVRLRWRSGQETKED